MTARQVVALCVVCECLSYCDRVNLSVAIVQLAKQQSWTLEQRSYVLGAFFPGYILTQVVGSLLAGKFGGPAVLGAVVLAWSTITLVTPMFATNLHALYICRFVLGLAEGMAVPAIYHIISNERYVDQKDRGIVVSALALGNQIGAMLAFLLCPAIIAAFDWTAVFYSFGCLGYIWFVLWFACHWQEEKQHARKQDSSHNSPKSLEAGKKVREAIYSHADGTKERVQVLKEHPYGEGGGFTIFVPSLQRERQTIEERLEFDLVLSLLGPEPDQDTTVGAMVERSNPRSGHAPELSLASLAFKMMTDPASLVLFACHFSLGCAHFVTLTWMPTYFADRWGMEQGAQWIMMMPYVGCLVILPLSGHVNDLLLRREKHAQQGHTLQRHSRQWTVLSVRRVFNSVSFFGCSAFLYFVSTASSPAVSMLFLSMAQAISMISIGGGFEVNKLDIATTPRAVSLLQGISQTIGNASGIVVVPATAYIATHWGWDAVFVAIGAQLAAVGMLYLRFSSSNALFA
jgi:MFS family permease